MDCSADLEKAGKAYDADQARLKFVVTVAKDRAFYDGKKEKKDEETRKYESGCRTVNAGNWKNDLEDVEDEFSVEKINFVVEVRCECTGA